MFGLKLCGCIRRERKDSSCYFTPSHHTIVLSISVEEECSVVLLGECMVPLCKHRFQSQLILA